MSCGTSTHCNLTASIIESSSGLMDSYENKQKMSSFCPISTSIAFEVSSLSQLSVATMDRLIHNNEPDYLLLSLVRHAIKSFAVENWKLLWLMCLTSFAMLAFLYNINAFVKVVSNRKKYNLCHLFFVQI